MRKLHFLGILGLVFCVLACVKPKLYRAEQTARTQSEAREKVLTQQLIIRQTEAATLVQQVGDLNRTIGSQELELRNLTKELTVRTQQMGESSGKLATEKSAAEKELAEKISELGRRNAIIQRVKDAQGKRTKALNDLRESLVRAYPASNPGGILVALEADAVTLLFPDKSLFDATGMLVSPAGKTALTPLTEYLTNHPELEVEVTCHTDNVLPPKEKNLKDTWEWSLQRATNVVRLLIRDFNVNANQLTPVGRGEFTPLVSNETAEGRQKNRRTALVIRTVLPAIPAAE